MADVKFTDNSKEVLDRMDKALDRGMEAIGLTAEGYAKKGTPVDTGRLRNSMTYAITKTGSERAVFIGTNVEYGPYVELGAQGREGVHMIKNAAANHTDKYKSLLKASVENA